MKNKPPKLIETHIARTVQILFSKGIRLEFGTDFKIFKDLAESLPDKEPLHPAFDCDEDRADRMNGVWMIGRNTAGHIVHTQAIKLLKLGETSLQQYLNERLVDFRFHGYDLDIERSQTFFTSHAARMSGRVTYHGELWIKGGPDGIRGGSSTALLTRLLLMIAQQRWSPDYMIGLQSPTLCCRGLSVKEGYAHVEQQSLLWHRLDGGKPLEDWLVWMTREEALFNLRISPDYFQELFEKAPDPERETAAIAA